MSSPDIFHTGDHLTLGNLRFLPGWVALTLAVALARNSSTGILMAVPFNEQKNRAGAILASDGAPANG
jgi:hypothetical protein